MLQILIREGKKENLKDSILAGSWIKYPLLSEWWLGSYKIAGGYINKVI